MGVDDTICDAIADNDFNTLFEDFEYYVIDFIKDNPIIELVKIYINRNSHYSDYDINFVNDMINKALTIDKEYFTNEKQKLIESCNGNMRQSADENADDWLEMENELSDLFNKLLKHQTDYIDLYSIPIYNIGNDIKRDLGLLPKLKEYF